MAGITRSLNLNMLFLFVFFVILFVAGTLFFHQQSSSLATKYQKVSKELQSTKENLDLASGELNKTLGILDVKEMREEDITTKYTEVQDAKESLESKNEKLTKNLQSSQTKAKLLEEQYDSLKEQSDARELDFAKVKALLLDLDELSAQLTDVRKDLQSDYGAIHSKNAASESITSELNNLDDDIDSLQSKIGTLTSKTDSALDLTG